MLDDAFAAVATPTSVVVLTRRFLRIRRISFTPDRPSAREIFTRGSTGAFVTDLLEIRACRQLAARGANCLRTGLT